MSEPDDAVPYSQFEYYIEQLHNMCREDVVLVFDGSGWDIRLGDPNGFSESTSEWAFNCVLDCLGR